jgi:hypothetical protein
MEDKDAVTIRDIDVPFLRIIVILVKWSIAAIPALIIYIILWTLFVFVFGAIFGLILKLFGVDIGTYQ